MWSVHATHFGCPLSFPTGATSWISSTGMSKRRAKSSGTLHKKTYDNQTHSTHSSLNSEMLTLPSSDPEAMRESLKGFLQLLAWKWGSVAFPYQSVSSTTAVCPRKSGIRSGSLPFSLVGMTANAPPPLASQLTAMYSGLACPVRPLLLPFGGWVQLTLTRFESNAFLDILTLS